MKGLEPPRPETLDPKSNAATITPHAPEVCCSRGWLPATGTKVRLKIEITKKICFSRIKGVTLQPIKQYKTLINNN